MDFKMLLKLKGIWDKFTKNHPKFPSFIKEFQKRGLKEGSIIDLKITYPDNVEIEANIKLCAEDLAIIEELKSMKK